MPDDNRQLIYRAQIEALACAATVAIKTRDSEAFTAASRQLLNLAVDIEVPSAIRDVAGAIHETLSLQMTDAGLNAMNATVSKLADATGQLRAAIDSARTGKEKLFFPAVADAASRALATLDSVRSAVEKVRVDLRAASDAQLGDIPQKLRALLADLDTLNKAIQNG